MINRWRDSVPLTVFPLIRRSFFVFLIHKFSRLSKRMLCCTTGQSSIPVFASSYPREPVIGYL